MLSLTGNVKALIFPAETGLELPAFPETLNTKLRGDFFMEFFKELKKNKSLYAMTLPGMIALIIFCYLPMIGIIIAFKDYIPSQGYLGSRWVGFKNFEFLFKTEDAFIITRNTVLYNLVFIFLGLFCSVATAVILSEIKNKWLAKTFQTGMLLPHFLSWVVVSYFVYAFLSTDTGILNRGLSSLLGLPAVNWYADLKPWPFFLVFANLWKGIGWSSIIYLAAITGINPEYYEAALLDGATKWQQIRKITVPMITPQISILFLLSVGGIFRSDFGLFYLVPKNSGILYPVTQTIDTYIYVGLTTMGDVGMSSAAGLYQSVVGFILVIGSNLIVRRIDSEKALF